MSNVDQFLFELYTHCTLQNQILHSFLTLVEYYPLLISSMNSIDKIKAYNQLTYNKDKKTNLLLDIYPYRIQTKGFENYYITGFFALIMFFLFFYLIFNCVLSACLKINKSSGTFTHKSNSLIFLGNIYVNFYDIIFMVIL